MTDKEISTLLVREQISATDNHLTYATLKGGQDLQFKAWTTSSVGANSINFSCVPVAFNAFVDPKIMLQLACRATFTGTNSSGGNLINPGQFAIRQFPINSALTNATITINGVQFSVTPCYSFPGMFWYNNDLTLSEHEYSTTPSYLDQSQQYSDLFGSNRSPLGFYSDSAGRTLRGAFPYTIVTNTTTTAVVDFVITEPIFLSPLRWGSNRHNGLYGITQMDFTLQFVSGSQLFNRMISIDNASSGNVLTISSSSISFNQFSPAFSYGESQPFMLIKYVSPPPSQQVEFPLYYPYFKNWYAVTPSSGALASGSSTTATSNNLILSSIPKRLYIWVRDQSSTLFASPFNTESFCGITNVSINFGVRSQILATATRRQLYEMCVKNGCQMSWEQWSGDALNKPGYSGTMGTVGSVIVVSFGDDIPLNDDEAPGKGGINWNLYVQLTFFNPSSRTITPEITLVPIYEGFCKVPYVGGFYAEEGPLTKELIDDANKTKGIAYNELRGIHYYGGAFGDVLSAIAKPFRKFGEVISELAPVVLAKKAANALPGLVEKGISYLPTLASSFVKHLPSTIASFIPGVGPIASIALKTVGRGEVRSTPNDIYNCQSMTPYYAAHDGGARRKPLKQRMNM